MPDIKLQPCNNSKGLTVHRTWGHRIMLIGHFSNGIEKVMTLSLGDVARVKKGERVTGISSKVPRRVRRANGKERSTGAIRTSQDGQKVHLYFPAWLESHHDLVVVEASAFLAAITL